MRPFEEKCHFPAEKKKHQKVQGTASSEPQPNSVYSDPQIRNDRHDHPKFTKVTFPSEKKAESDHAKKVDKQMGSKGNDWQNSNTSTSN